MHGFGDEARVCEVGRLKKKVDAERTVGWTGWRGPNRDGRVNWLPNQLPAEAKFAWQKELSALGLGGVAATADYVLISDRDLQDTTDVFKCLRAADGEEVWAIRFPALGNFDYGNSARATPLIDGDRVYLFTAFGHLACAELSTGKIVWDMNIRDEFDSNDERKWGMCSSPLLADGKLIVNPGAKDASLVALDPKTGKTIWKTPGRPASYGSLIVGMFGGKRQIVGYDLDSLGGWDVATGKRLWTLEPERKGDFNVPTPIQVGERLLVTTENHGTRLYAFNEQGVIQPKPAAINRALAPDTHTPVVVGDRVFGVWRRLYCLNLKDELKPLWNATDNAFGVYCAAIASADRVLILTRDGELILLDAAANEFKPLGRLTLWKEERGCYAHPALAGTRLYLRSSSSVTCLDLAQ